MTVKASIELFEVNFITTKFDLCLLCQTSKENIFNKFLRGQWKKEANKCCDKQKLRMIKECKAVSVVKSLITIMLMTVAKRAI